jgi:hypothetical protein
MNKKIIWQIVGVGAVAVILLLGVSAITERNNAPNGPAQEVSQAQSASVTIEGLYVNKSIEFSSPKTVLDLLKQLDTQDKEVRLVTKEYSGLGILVEGIGDKANGTDGKYWQYKVNGVMPQVGADKLEIKSGDTIEWYFDESES